MTLYELWQEGSRALSQANDAEGEQDAKLLLFEAFQLDLVHFLMDRLRPLPEQDAKTEEKICAYRGMIKQRAAHIPLQQILGSQEFMGLDFYVNEHVLIPRQDTETLVELVLAEQPGSDKKLLDVCTGSGCIAISLAVKGGYESVTATDLSEEALKVAKQNAGTHQKEIRFYQGDLFEALTQKEAGSFDIITSNPPYIPTAVIATLEPEVREHEPRMALDGTADGLEFYRRIAKNAGTWLKPGGTIYLEIGHDQGEAVSGLLEDAGLKHVRVVKDLPGKDRVVCGSRVN